jgi:hypothetical protein
VEEDMREARCLKVEGMTLGQQRREKVSVGVELELERDILDMTDDLGDGDFGNLNLEIG